MSDNLWFYNAVDDINDVYVNNRLLYVDYSIERDTRFNKLSTDLILKINDDVFKILDFTIEFLEDKHETAHVLVDLNSEKEIFGDLWYESSYI